MIRGELVGKRAKVNDRFHFSPGIQPSVLSEVQVLRRILIATQRELDKKSPTGKFSGIGHINTKVVFDIRLWKRLIGGSTVRANINCVSSN